MLAAHGDSTGTHTWRSGSSTSARYFGWLTDNGYPLSEVEALAGPSKKVKRT